MFDALSNAKMPLPSELSASEISARVSGNFNGKPFRDLINALVDLMLPAPIGVLFDVFGESISIAVADTY